MCIATFVKIDGVCKCPDNTIFNSQNRNCVRGDPVDSQNNCGVEEVFDGQNCVFCRNGTYPNPLERKCSFCVDRCTYCINGISCLNCESGYSFQVESSSCSLITCEEDEILFEDKCYKECPVGTFRKGESCTHCA